MPAGVMVWLGDEPASDNRPCTNERVCVVIVYGDFADRGCLDFG